MACPGRSHGCDGSSALRIRGDRSLLASMGVLGKLCRRIGSHYALSHQEGPRAPRAPHERRSDRRETADPEGDHAGYVESASSPFLSSPRWITASGGPPCLSAERWRGTCSWRLASISSPSCIERTRSPRTIEIAEHQKVIDTGPYALVRHPMYASALLYLVGTPLALDSYWGLVPLVAMMPFLIWRLLAEERFLAQNLRGYTEYQKRVRHRLVPFVW